MFYFEREVDGKLNRLFVAKKISFATGEISYNVDLFAVEKFELEEKQKLISQVHDISGSEAATIIHQFYNRPHSIFAD